jgi:hypothetical protein
MIFLLIFLLIFFSNFNISENNIISVKIVKLLMALAQILYHYKSIWFFHTQKALARCMWKVNLCVFIHYNGWCVMFIVAYITLKCGNLTIAKGENTSFIFVWEEAFGDRLKCLQRLDPS